MTESAQTTTHRDPSDLFWVWRSAGRGNQCHLIPQDKVTSANPHALCRRRVRKPQNRWTGVCHDCMWAMANPQIKHEPFPGLEKA